MAVFAAIVLVIYFAQSVLIAVGTRVLSNGSFFQEVMFSILEHVSILTINFLVFTFVFKYLHDGVVRWKLALSGSLFTAVLDRKSTRLNTSHVRISYAVFCLKKKNILICTGRELLRNLCSE